MPEAPPFRADNVGSLLRPAAVKAARKRFTSTGEGNLISEGDQRRKQASRST
jgi:methionine synthase II (cobalamin-independent)